MSRVSAPGGKTAPKPISFSSGTSSVGDDAAGQQEHVVHAAARSSATTRGNELDVRARERSTVR